MAVFSKQTCEHCGNSAGAMTRMKLADGKYLCGDCCKKIPNIINVNFLARWTYNDFLEYLKTREENKKRLESFNITDVYFDDIYVDMDKGWMVFSDYKNHFTDKESMLKENPDIFEIKDLVYYDFFYKIKDVKQGFINDKVKADVRLIIAFNSPWYPYSYNEKVLRNYKHKAQITGFVNQKVSFTDDEKKSDLECYLLSSLIENKVNIPFALGGKFTMNFDFSPYDTYLEKIFELEKLWVYKGLEFDEKLETITPSFFLRRKLKKIYKNKK